MKKLICVALAIAIISLTLPLTYAASYNGFTLEKNSKGCYVITDYNGSADYINIPEAVNGIKITAIGKNAFKQNSRINTVKLSDTVISIGANSFYGCKNLSSVILSDSVTSIGSKAFSGCISLTGINLKNVKTVGEHAFYGCKNITNLTMGSALKVIGNYAFQKCSSLSFIKFANTLTYIGNYTFANCSSLTNLKFPDSLVYIGNSAFKNCTGLETITFGSGALEIGAYAFESCNKISEITIPNTVKSIGRYAFAARPASSNTFTHSATLYCSKNSAGGKYAKLYNAPAYINEYNKLFKAFGDFDNDGKLEKSDAKSLLRIAASMDSKISGEKLYCCDINSNNQIDIGDISAILKNI